MQIFTPLFFLKSKSYIKSWFTWTRLLLLIIRASIYIIINNDTNLICQPNDSKSLDLLFVSFIFDNERVFHLVATLNA